MIAAPLRNDNIGGVNSSMKTAITGHISDEATTAITGLTSNVAANAGQEVKKDA